MLGTVAVVAMVAVSSGAAPVAAEFHKLDQVIILTAPVINSFWASYFDEEGLKYRMPQINYYNTPTEPGTGKSACGELPPENAFYCPLDQDIYLDYVFLNKMIDESGDASVAMILAHEWVHHIHHRMGFLVTMDGELNEDNEVLSIEAELMADCFSGVAMANYKELGMLEEGDIDEAYDISIEFGDPVCLDPTEHGAHGDGETRKKVLKGGFRSGEPADCQSIVTKNLKNVL